MRKSWSGWCGGLSGCGVEPRVFNGEPSYEVGGATSPLSLFAAEGYDERRVIKRVGI